MFCHAQITIFSLEAIGRKLERLDLIDKFKNGMIKIGGNNDSPSTVISGCGALDTRHIYLGIS